MKNIIRLFALALVATGAAASLHASSTPTSITLAGKVTPPAALCPPDDPNACGIVR